MGLRTKTQPKEARPEPGLSLLRMPLDAVDEYAAMRIERELREQFVRGVVRCAMRLKPGMSAEETQALCEELTREA